MLRSCANLGAPISDIIRVKPKPTHRWLARAQVVQEIKVLRSSVSQREKEKAERATLVVQDRLVKAKARAPATREVLLSWALSPA